jgi:hypothetical protein
MGTQNMSGSMMQSSFVLEETENHSVELYGTTLPVTVTEILTLTESKSVYQFYYITCFTFMTVKQNCNLLCVTVE